jgi:radical SAM superfamily enzyme YgiQ (UPF0313 family)
LKDLEIMRNNENPGKHPPMKILLVYPKYPDTFWSFRYALKFISKKAASPPLGLLTVAALLPAEWEKELVDTNVRALEDRQIRWADFVFVSAISIQAASAKEIISRCNAMGTKVVAGGPLFTSEQENFQGVDHLILNEGELTLPGFLEDLKRGQPRHAYTTDRWANIEQTPVPLWGLVNLKEYASMNIQYSRGCPFQCDFCNIAVLYGRSPRTKNKDQIIAELENLYVLGWRGSVFFVDDNFIGNKGKLKKEVLPALISWMKRRRYPFAFHTEVSLNLSDDRELMKLMVKAGFDTVFIGIETPNEESLLECNKLQNKGRDLKACIQRIQESGLQVQGGFIVGFDSDPIAIFEKVIRFIQESAIVTAMIGLLNAPRGTKLYQRLRTEGRLLKDITGDHMDLSMNFVPKMNYDTLVSGYRKILNTIYAPQHYYERLRRFLKDYRPIKKTAFHFHFRYVGVLVKLMLYLGIIGEERAHFWRLFFWSLLRRPRLFPLAMTLTIYGFHFKRVAHKINERASI